jgi:Ribbon-helix-helix domain
MVAVKKRRTFMIELDVLEKLRSIKARTGISESEQVRQGIQWWLQSREWPPRTPEPDPEELMAKAAHARLRKRR